jgi:MYM-type Zinc finger with FCS sequence motif
MTGQFTCEGCGKMKADSPGVEAEHVDGEKYQFCDETCATIWLGACLVLDEETAEIDSVKSTAAARRRRNARKN